MARFTLEIETGNDAMQNSEQLAEALRKVSNRIKTHAYSLEEELLRGIMDENGNTVGSWRIEP